MAVIYATLIVKGKKTINDVPPVIREQVTRYPANTAPTRMNISEGFFFVVCMGCYLAFFVVTVFFCAVFFCCFCTFS